MATVTPLGTGAAATPAANLTFTVTDSVSIGDFIVVAGGIFGSRVTHTAADSAGNTYTQRALSNQRTAIFIAPCTSALTSGVSTITVSWGGTETARTAGAAKVTATTLCSFDVAATNNGSTAAWTGGTTASTSFADELVIGACSCDTAGTATDTPSPGIEVFDIDNGGAFQLTMTYQIVGTTGTQTSGGTWTSTGHTWNAATATFQIDASGGGGSPTVKTLAALGVG